MLLFYVSGGSFLALEVVQFSISMNFNGLISRPLGHPLKTRGRDL